MRIGRVGSRVAIFSAFALCAGARAQAEGSPVLMEGMWQASLSVTSHSTDGTAAKSKTKVDLAIADFGTAGLAIGSFRLPTGQMVPGMAGRRLARSFSAEAEGVALAAGVKRDPVTGEGISFKGTGFFSTPSEIRVFRISGKRLAGIAAPAQIPLFLEEFDLGLGPYTETNLFPGTPAATFWHAEQFCAPATSIPASMGFKAAAYNRGDEIPPVYTYDTGDDNCGALQGPAIEAPSDAPGLSVTFDILRDVEGPGTSISVDSCRFEVREVGCGTWLNVAHVTQEVLCSGTPITVTIAGGPALGSLLGKRFLHRFRFDTDDDIANNFLGWYVDNVRIGVVNP